MILIEFDENIGDEIIVKYKNINDDKWYYLIMDLLTLNNLINNYGCVSTKIYNKTNINCDNPTTGKEINVKYHKANISMFCNKTINSGKYLHHLEENY